MDINKLLDTIDKGLREVQNEILDNLTADAKAQRAKTVEARLRDLESQVARMKWEVSGIKSTLALSALRVDATQTAAPSAPRKRTKTR